MNFEQNEEENKAEFIARLMEAGWTRTEAEDEWDDIQKNEEIEE